VYQNPLSYSVFDPVVSDGDCQLIRTITGFRKEYTQEARERIAQEREQHYHFTLHDFEELVRQYGIGKIFKDLDEEIYWMIHQNITLD